MGRNALDYEKINLIILYTDLSTERTIMRRCEVDTYLNFEGDHVMDWYIEEDMKNERLRKEGG